MHSEKPHGRNLEFAINLFVSEVVMWPDSQYCKLELSRRPRPDHHSGGREKTTWALTERSGAADCPCRVLTDWSSVAAEKNSLQHYTGLLQNISNPLQHYTGLLQNISTLCGSKLGYCRTFPTLFSTTLGYWSTFRPSAALYWATAEYFQPSTVLH